MAKLNENAQKWVAALRSKKYTQGKDCLAQHDQFCCLGVLCELAIENGVPLVKTEGSSGLTHYDGSSTYLPLSVKKWIGLKTNRGHFGKSSLADKNDEGFTFEHIARLIEDNAEELGVSA